ncbi:hypothetical protein INT46_008621 [Mucor plumbeus]|uniref:Uncharacterized protein n=1 Tax=Mucor plumbeus TaxID=97098 RepID=A0A8H7US82_9FUNG|nr:hypothetical protein INT46_008621 [Mucor plumbeus]
MPNNNNNNNNNIPLTLDIQEEEIPVNNSVEFMSLIDPVEWEAYMDDKLAKRLHFKLKQSLRQNYNYIYDEIASINSEIEFFTDEAKITREKRKIDFDKKLQDIETQEDALQADHTLEMAHYTYATWKRLRRN